MAVQGHVDEQGLACLVLNPSESSELIHELNSKGLQQLRKLKMSRHPPD
jgi:hypothetical protein